MQVKNDGWIHTACELKAARVEAWRAGSRCIVQVWCHVSRWLNKQALHVVMKGADPQAALNDVICSYAFQLIDGTILVSSLARLAKWHSFKFMSSSYFIAASCADIG